MVWWERALCWFLSHMNSLSSMNAHLTHFPSIINIPSVSAQVELDYGFECFFCAQTPQQDHFNFLVLGVDELWAEVMRNLWAAAGALQCLHLSTSRLQDGTSHHDRNWYSMSLFESWDVKKKRYDQSQMPFHSKSWEKGSKFLLWRVRRAWAWIAFLGNDPHAHICTWLQHLPLHFLLSSKVLLSISASLVRCWERVKQIGQCMCVTVALRKALALAAQQPTGTPGVQGCRWQRIITATGLTNACCRNLLPLPQKLTLKYCRIPCVDFRVPAPKSLCLLEVFALWLL